MARSTLTLRAGHDGLQQLGQGVYHSINLLVWGHWHSSNHAENRMQPSVTPLPSGALDKAQTGLDEPGLLLIDMT